MARTILVTALLLGLPALVTAQTTSIPQPSIGLPLPSIGLALPPIGIAPGTTEHSTPSTSPPLPSPPPAIIYFGRAPYAWGFESWQQSAMPGVIPSPPVVESSSTPAAAQTGRLQLEGVPRDAQIFVDGEFAGTWSDLDGTLDLPAGSYRIEIRARGHDADVVDARIVAGRTITYRAEMRPLAARSATPAPAGAADAVQEPETAAKSRVEPATPRQTFYLIPGCYLGNIPPDEVKLPPGCDLTRLITHTPQQ